MRTITLLVLVFTGFVPCLLSQSYQIHEKKDGNWVLIQNGSTVNRNCKTKSDGVNEGFAVKSTAGEYRKTWARKIVHSQVEKAINAFCWNGCMNPDQYLSKTYVNMKPDSLYTEQFTVHFLPDDVTGNTQITYSFFDRDHLADSAWFTIMYSTLAGLDDPSNPGNRLIASPNPASGLVTFRNIPMGFTGKLVVTNVLGKRIIEMTGSGRNTEMIINLSQQPEGIYFYFLEQNNSKGSAGKLMIKR